MKIKNFYVLAVSNLRRAALRVAEAGLAAIDTGQVLKKAVRVDGGVLRVNKDGIFSLEKTKRIFVVAVGKCAVEAGLALENILGDRLAGGVVVDVKGGGGFKKLKLFKGTHPLPSPENVKAAQAVVEELRGLNEDDLVVFAVSGGGSTLLCLPDGAEYEEEAKIVKTLMKNGATIREINTLRKHLSLARGGYLAKYAYPAQVVSLIFSDVPGDDLGFVASGPTVKDTTTIEEAETILAKYDILRACGLERCGLVETPKEDKYFEKVKNIVVASNIMALEAMEAKAAELGFRSQICTTCLLGEAAEIGLRTIENLHSVSGKSAFLYGGETTVNVLGDGRGGRNLELALSALRDVQGGELLLTLASDGRDNGEFAGAICDTITKEAVGKAGFNVETELKNSNSYPVFEKAGNYLLTGDTGSNVSDLVIALKE